MSSEDSIAPHRLGQERLKPGPGALPADAFDPLKHSDTEQFWHAIDGYFQPINQNDVSFLRAIPLNPYGGQRDHHLRLAAEEPCGKRPAKSSRKDDVEDANSKDHSTRGSGANAAADANGDVRLAGASDVSTLAASLNSFPFTHRLVAAMLDVGGATGAPSQPGTPARPSRILGGVDAGFWMGVGIDGDVRQYQKTVEERVKIELVENGLIDERNDDELQSALREEQWKLRDVKSVTRMRKTTLYTLIIGTELRAQAMRREVKRHHDQVEIAYLERMVRNMKKNKKSRSKYQRLLQRMFGHYKETEKKGERGKKGVEAITNGRVITTGEERGRSVGKKKKKKGDVVPSAGYPGPANP